MLKEVEASEEEEDSGINSGNFLGKKKFQLGVYLVFYVKHGVYLCTYILPRRQLSWLKFFTRPRVCLDLKQPF